ncbi:hypothetical protein SNE26_23820 [Mucilaginibacter sp. cycad4]|uniref:hypothetical protein n=1 Tax=Mucilaginibacter sp. cycad4 TaxID=3342096 RepID=UPI002AAB2FCD|nr:hypothetical protein [Mucilaginibacter gossypii]WPU99044.1 hypothetical protein SNE26_23820 [Mucilaginibacter gossypii]
MSDILERFAVLILPEKITFLAEDFFAEISNVSKKDLKTFLSSIISDSAENVYIKKQAIDRLMDLVFLNSIKPRQALGILLDDWEGTNLLLTVNRVKSLYYLYEQDPDEIETIFTAYSKEDEAELSAEALFHLGLINLQKGLLASELEYSLFSLEKSKSDFHSASQLIENRIDAVVFTKIVELTIDVIKKVTASLSNKLKELASLLFQRESYAFSFVDAPFYVGFYRVLYGLLEISQQTPSSWLDFRHNLTNLFFQYSSIQNQEIKSRLSLSTLTTSFIEKLDDSFFLPFFSLNFSAEKSRISARLGELDETSEEASFLKKIIELSTGDLKKKASIDSLKFELAKIFPLVSIDTINNLLTSNDDLSEGAKLFKVFEILQKPSTVQLNDALIRSCLQLQSMRIYYGNYSEDDRNTMIASLLESSGFLIKDQTRRSRSQTGKSAGEVDILVEDYNHNPISIIEAMNLTSVQKDYIKQHIDKIFTYDANGLVNNYILVYANVVNFGTFYTNYRNYVRSNAFQFPLISLTEANELPYSEIRKFTIIHRRNNLDVNMNHILINLFDK